MGDKLEIGTLLDKGHKMIMLTSPDRANQPLWSKFQGLGPETGGMSNRSQFCDSPSKTLTYMGQ